MAAMTLKQFSDWYLKVGMRTMKEIVSPELHPMGQFILPAQSTIHYMQSLGGGTDDVDSDEDDDGLVLGPLMTDPLLANFATVEILVEPLTRYIHEPLYGNSRVVIATVTEQLAKYYNTAPKLKRLSKNISLINDRNLCMYTYTTLDSVYAYEKTDKAEWHRFCNWYTTFLMNVKKSLSEYPTRNHFLHMEPPALLNSLSTLRNLANEIDVSEPYVDRVPQKAFKLFRSMQEKIFLDMWMFLGENKQKSLFNEIMGDVDYSKLNILWQVGGGWCVLNMGRLLKMLMDPVTNKGTLKPKEMEAKWLIHVMRLSAKFHSVDNGAPEDDESIDPEEQIAELDKPVRELNIDAARSSAKNIDIALERPARRKPLLSESEALNKLKAEMKLIDSDKSLDRNLGGDDDDAVMNAAIERDLDQLEAISAQRIIENTYEDRYRAYEPVKLNNLDGVNKAIDAMAKKGQLSAKEVARLKRNALSFQEAKNPWGGKGTIAEYMEINEDDLIVPEVNKIAESIDGIIDEGMLSSSITFITKNYVENILRKDILNAVMHLQNGPYVVTDVKVQRHVDIMNDFEVMTAKVMTTRGKEKSITIKYPTVKADGSYLVGGVKQRLRPQHSDNPLRKVSPTRVAMTSYVSKIFLERTDRAAFNYSRWFVGNLRSHILEDTDGDFKNVVYGKVFDRTRKYPRAYGAIAMSIKGFDYQGYKFNFDYAQSAKVFTGQQLAFAKKNKVIPMATNGSDGLYLTMDGIVIQSKGEERFDLGSIEKLFKLDESKVPVDYVEYNLLGDTVPLGVILGYHLGLGNLLATLGAKPRRVSRGASYALAPNEFIVKFQDEALVFDRKDRVTSLLMSGFNRYKRDISRMSIYAFDTPDIYSVLLSNNKINPRKLVDVDSTMMYWVDHITAGLLKARGLPTDLVGLMIKATEMLAHDQHSDPNAASEQRERGQERIAGAIIGELYNAARSHMGKTLMMAGGFDLNPNATWYKILNDTANMGIEESNPIHFLKEQEEITLGGDGGRSGRTLMGKDRKFSPESMGVISEATVDSGEVAAKIFTTADPNYSTLRGETRQLPKGVNLNTKATKLQSTSMLLSVGADRDD